MTAVPANIVINFTSNYAGPHRVAYRIGSSGAYSFIDVNCAIVGSCQAVIPITVDQDTCVDVSYEGYIQASCEDINSTTGRLAWQKTFTPTPNCKSYLVTCSRLAIDSITISNGGSGYITAPAVSFVGGGGSATGVAQIGSGGITSFVISSGGSGYVNGTHTNVLIVGGSGSGGRATVVVSGGVVTSVTITTAGTGYVEGDTITLDNSGMGGAPGVAASLSVHSNLHKLLSVIEINTTVKFTSIPTVVFTGGEGSGAIGHVVMEDCPEITADGCIGSPVDIPAGALTGFGESVAICDQSTPSVSDQYSVAENGNCLCSCITATMSVTGSNGDQIRVIYNKCGLEVRSTVLTVGGSPQSITDCVVPGSVIFQTIDSGASGTVNYGDEC